MNQTYYEGAGMVKMVSRFLAVILAVVIIFSTGACSPQTAPTADVAAFKDPETVVYSERFGYFPVNQIAVVFYDDVNSKKAAGILKQIGGKVVGELGIINLYQIETNFTTEAELNAAMEAARALDSVELVFPNAEIVADITVEGTPCSPLNDPVFEDPQNAKEYEIIGLENASRIIKGSGVNTGKVKMCALDSALYTGADDAGEFMGNSRVKGPTTDQAYTDRHGQLIAGGLSHGRMVSNVMSGIAGILDDDVEIEVANVFSSQPEYTEIQENQADITQGVYGGTAYVIKSLVYLKQQVDKGATVINCSFNPSALVPENEEICKAYTKFFKYMQNKKPGVVFVCSAGNEASADKTEGGTDGKNNFPGGLPLPNVITVGALDDDGSRASFSNFEAEGGEVTLSAPGVDMVVGLDKDGKPVKSSGTSFAAPQVAAAVALLQSINPKLNAVDIKKLLVETAAPGVTNYTEPGKISSVDYSIPIPEGMGAGVLRVDEAVLRAINDLRREEGKEPYTLQQALDMGRVMLTAVGEDAQYALTAHIPAALSGSTEVKIEVMGDHSMSERTTQTVQTGGVASWKISLEGDSAFIRVTRLDNNACATMTLKSVSEETGSTSPQMAGTYSGSAVLQHVEEDVEAPDSLPVTLYLNEGGTGTVEVYGFGGKAEYTGSSVTFSVTMEEDGWMMYCSFVGNVSRSGDRIVISGTMRLSMMGVTFATYSWTAQK